MWVQRILKGVSLCILRARQTETSEASCPQGGASRKGNFVQIMPLNAAYKAGLARRASAGAAGGARSGQGKGKMGPSSLIQDFSVEVSRLDRNRWMDVLGMFDDASIYQTWSYGAIRWSEDNLSHLILRKNGEVVAAGQCTIKTLPGIKVGIGFIPWGPVWRLRGMANDSEVFQQMLRALKEEYVERRQLFLQIVPNIIHGESGELFQMLEKEGFELDKSAPVYRTYMMDLSFSMEELRTGLKRQWRQNLQSAETKELKIVEGASNELYLTFLDLYKQMLARKDFEPGVDVEEYGKIQAELPDQYKMHIMVCEFREKPVAGLVASYLGNMGIALHAATSEEALNLRAAYLLQWRMIEWLKNSGAKWYDLGGINPEKNPGGFQYKSGLCGKCGNDVRHLGQFYRSQCMASSMAVRLGKRFRETYRKFQGRLDAFSQ